MTITVYTKPNCVQCDSTKRYLDSHSVEYTTVDITADEAAYKSVVDMGFSSVPVVVTETAKWAGFKYDQLVKAANEFHLFSKATA